MKPDWLACLLQGIGALWRSLFPRASKPPPIGGTDISDAPPPESEPAPPTDDPPSEPETPPEPKEATYTAQIRRSSPHHKHGTPPREHARTPPTPHPELICRETDRGWAVILTAPEDSSLTEVFQNGNPLPLTNSKECPVPSLRGRLQARCHNGREHDIPLFEGGKPLLFRMRKDWRGEGRQTTRLASGHFIIIAPANWQRIGNPPVAPESCADTNFQAHFFALTATEEETVAFKGKWKAPPSASAFQLNGTVIFDDSNEGDLFVGSAPELNSSREIVWARVGAKEAEQPLAEILGKRQGRFSLRICDADSGKLADRLTFRYLRDLKEIRVDGKPYDPNKMLLPPAGGYPRITEIKFIDQTGKLMRPRPTGDTIAADKSGILQIPPNPNADHIECKLGRPLTGGVTILLHLPRIWWRLESAAEASPAWQDTPLIMTRQEFQNRALEDATISLRLKGITRICVGFDKNFGAGMTQKYRRRIADPHFSFPLHGLDDFEQIRESLAQDAHLYIGWGDDALPIIRITADPAPATLVTETETADDDGADLFHPAEKPPSPCVKNAAGKWRVGKRFSKGEVRAAGLTVQEAKRLRLPVDSRRKRVHDRNTRKLRRWVNAR